MFSDTAEETSSSTMTMCELQLQVPRDLSPSPPPPPLFSSKCTSASSSEQVDFPGNGLDFYSSPFDNPFPYKGIERTFSCSSPTANTSFISESSFTNQPPIKQSQDSEITSFSENFGLLENASNPFMGIENEMDIQRAYNNCGVVKSSDDGMASFLTSPPTSFNDSGLSSSSSFGPVNQSWDSPKTATSTSNNQFDFSFSISEPSQNGSGSSNGSSDASADSPTRLINGHVSSVGFQWSSGEVSPFVEQRSFENPNDNSLITTSGLGNSIWSPSQVSSVGTGNSQNNDVVSINEQRWESALTGLSKKQLLNFVELLQEKYDECIQDGDTAKAVQLQNARVHVQQYIIEAFVFESAGNACSVSSPKITIPPPLLQNPGETSLDRVAKQHRDINGDVDAPYTWSGSLPPRVHRNPVYSSKVFLGGLPWDITEGTLMQAFKPYGIIKIEWPGKEGISGKPKGYAYAVFESEKSVKHVLQNCTHDYSNSRSGNFYYKISSKKFRCKDVQIIPWALNDSNFARCQASKIDPLKTVFVGALHGMINAEGLAKIMNDLFDNVIYAGIDTDKHKYPIGSARVTFNSTRSYDKAVNARFVVIKTSRFEKTLQVDPYLEDAICSVCEVQQGPYFCRDNACFSYFCRTCFHSKHAEEPLRSHRPMMRTTHNKQPGGNNNSSYQSTYVFGSNNGSNGHHHQMNQQQSGNNYFQQNHQNGSGYYNQNNHQNGNTYYNQNNHQNGNNYHQQNHHQNGHNQFHQNQHSQNGNNQYYQNNQQQHGFGGHQNNRQWNNTFNANSGGRDTQTMNQLNSSTSLLSLNGSSSGGNNNRFNNNGSSNGGHYGGGGNSPNGNVAQGDGQPSVGTTINNGNSGNRNFGQVGHRQQLQFTRWQN